MENLGVLGDVLSRALATGGAASPLVQARLAQRWPRIRDGLLSAIDWRTATRRASLERALAQRQDAERRRVVTNLEQFAGTLRRALADDETEGALISLAEAAKSRDELAQYRRDRQSWEQRLVGLEQERDRELAMIADRYRDPQPTNGVRRAEAGGDPMRSRNPPDPGSAASS